MQEAIGKLKASGIDQRAAVVWLSGYCDGTAKGNPKKKYTAAEVAGLLNGLFEIGQAELKMS